MRKEIEVVHNETIRLCDDCMSNIPLKKQQLAQYQCEVCKKDLCMGCIEHFDSDRCSDYSEAYCKSCWTIGKYYKRKINKLRIKFDKEEDLLLKKWHDKALEEKK